MRDDDSSSLPESTPRPGGTGVAGAHEVGRDDRRAHEGHDPEDLERAEEVAAETARDEDPQTRREAIEQELAEEGISGEGVHIGQHVE